MPSFLMNYGGPIKGLTQNEKEFQSILDKCEDFYSSQKKSVSFTLNGLDVTYYMIGVHRMVRVDLPEQVLQDKNSSDLSVAENARKTEQLYKRVFSRAGDFNTGKYQLTKNNCVTASGELLKNIEPQFADKKFIIPFLLDKAVLKKTQAEQIADEIFRGTLMESQKNHSEKDFRQEHMAHEIWESVMTPVDEVPRQHQKDLKQKLHEKQDAPKQGMSQDKIAHRVWEEVMTSTPVKKSHQQELKDKLHEATHANASPDASEEEDSSDKAKL